MSKELEALIGLAQFIIMNDTGTDESASAIEWHGILKQALTNYEQLQQEVIARQETENSLTQWVADLTNELEALKKSPTVEEVCKAIQEELPYGTVKYIKGNKEFMFLNHGEKQNITDVYGDRHKITGFYKSSTITMIGKFYESLEGENE